MPFVNETISEADKARYESFHFTSPFSKYHLVSAWKWAIDRERNVFLVPMGGGGTEQSETPAIFSLVFDEQVSRIEAYYKYSGKEREGLDIYWRLTRIVIPRELQPKGNLVLELIKEAFGVIGVVDFGRVVVSSVHFDFIADPIFA
jgi:hypothetical protein